MIKTLLKQIKQYKKASVLSALFTVLEVILELFLPVLMARIIDNGISTGNMDNIYFYGVIMLVIAGLGLCCGVLAGKFAAVASAGVAANLRDSMYKNIQTFSFSNIDKYSTSGLVTRLTTDVTNVQNAYQMIVRMCVRAPISFISALVMSIIISAKISIIFVLAIVFLAIVISIILLKATPLFTKAFEKYESLNTDVQENVTAIRVVKSYVREDFEKKKFSKTANLIYNFFVKAEGLLAVNNPSMMLTIYGCIIAMSWLGAKMIVAGTLTTGQLTSLFTYIFNILISLMLLSMIFVMVGMSIASARRIAEIINETPNLKSPENPVKSIKNGNIDFENVYFSYTENMNDEYVLSDININIKEGETIGIVGGTGSGKTSLINLIPRLYDVTKGSVKIGGIDVKDYDLKYLRDNVAVVLQKNKLFSGTILENLRWGNENATDEECINACKMAQADEFIERFPDKYNTYIEQDGSNVSGGQKQRLCIARALLKQPKILIMDDSTSAVDTATDAKIRESFKNNLSGVTKLIIAQRISCIQHSDKIIVLDEGKIHNIGTHEELLKKDEIYRFMYESQTKKGGDFDEQ